MTNFAASVQSDFTALAGTLPGADVPWLRHIRETALDRFTRVGLPTPRDEDWKYTDLEALGRAAFRIGAETALDAAAFTAIGVPEISRLRLVLVDGRYDAGLSRLDGLPAGAAVYDLRTVLCGDASRLQRHLSGAAGDDVASAFVSLNSAFLSDGAFIDIAPGVQLDEPIHVVCVATHAATPSMSAPRIVLCAGANSRCSVVENYQGVGGVSTLTNVVTAITALAGATVDHYRVLAEGTRGYHFGNLLINGLRDSTVCSNSIVLGGDLSRIDIRAVLREPGAAVELNGLYIGGGTRLVDHHTTVEHVARETRSMQRYSGILDGASRGVFNGRVLVHPDAQKITAEQSNKNLLLSPDAEVDTKPQLEIYADDVKCSHGATVGQIDKDALFYLRSRGVDEPAARALLTYAFAHEVLRKMSLSAVCGWVEKSVIGQLGQSDLLRELT